LTKGQQNRPPPPTAAQPRTFSKCSTPCALARHPARRPEENAADRKPQTHHPQRRPGGHPLFGYNFSIAGVAGRVKGKFARGEAEAVGMDGPLDKPLPNGMAWNMVCDNAFMEGLNRVFSATKRQAWGYRSTTHMITMLYFVAANSASRSSELHRKQRRTSNPVTICFPH
jgi:hypothetical protein